MRKFAVIDTRMSEKCKKSLINLGFKLIEVQENRFLDKPVSAHPDLSIFKYDNNIISHIELGNRTKEQMFFAGECDYNFYNREEPTTDVVYPLDCPLNFAICGNHIIGKKSIADKNIIELSRNDDLIFIDVNQGYAKCNICVVDENSIITEDKGIARACTKFGIDVLLLETNSVKLEGYKHGFIGGATGTVFDKINGNKILFCGDIKLHPEHKRIYDFCKSKGAEAVSLSDDELYDYGSIIIL